MSTKPVRYNVREIESRILTIRGQKGILDRELAALYGVPTFRFNEAVKRNRRRFPEDFIFRMTADEFASLTSQIAISKPGETTKGTGWISTVSLLSKSSLPPFLRPRPSSISRARGSSITAFPRPVVIDRSLLPWR